VPAVAREGGAISKAGSRQRRPWAAGIDGADCGLLCRYESTMSPGDRVGGVTRRWVLAGARVL